MLPLETATGILALVFVILALTTLLSTRLHISPVMLEILIGMIIGPHVLNIIQITPELDFLKEMGLIILLFLAGLDFNFENFRKKIFDATLIAIPPGIVGFGLAALLIPLNWFSRIELLMIALVLTTTSISLSVSVLRSKLKSTPDNYDTVVLAIIISNVLMVLIAGMMINTIEQNSFGLIPVFLNFGIVLAFILSILYLSQKAKMVWYLTDDPEEEDILYYQTKFAFGILGFILLISFLLNIELAVASFFAGVYVKETTDLQRKDLTKFNIIGYGFLIPVFFVVMGMQVNPAHFLVLSVLGKIVLIIILSFFFQVTLTALSSYLANFSIKESIYIGIGLSACSLSGGFAILEIVNKSGAIAESTYSIIAAVITLSVLLTILGLEFFDYITEEEKPLSKITDEPQPVAGN